MISLICLEITKAGMTQFLCHRLFVNMPVTKKDKILITNLFTFEGYNANKLLREFPSKGWNVGSVYKLLQKLGRSTVVPAAADDAAPAVLMNWCYTKIARRE